MPQIRKRGASQYQVRIRLEGHPEITQTFTTKQDALAWATENAYSIRKPMTGKTM